MSKRPKMLASVIREIIAPVVRECPGECGVVSISKVDVSPDFTHATIYVSSLQEQQLAVGFLESKRLDLQRKLGTLYRKRIPTLRFRLDEATAEGNRLDELLESS